MYHSQNTTTIRLLLKWQKPLEVIQATDATITFWLKENAIQAFKMYF